MALQTKNFQSGTTSNQFYLQLTLTENSTNLTNNTSSISYTLKLYSGGWDFSLYRIGHSIKLAEKTVSSVARANANQYSLGTNSSITIASGTTTITHNSDGSKNMSVAFSIDMAKDSWTPGAISVSGKSMALTTIPRTSTVSCSTANIGSNATITINRASSSFTNTLSYTFNGLNGTIVTKTSNTSIAWTIPTTFYAKIPNSKSGTGTITCKTYNGNTLIGTNTCNFTATVSESDSKPTLSPTVVDNNSTTIALTGDNTKFIKYYSNAAVTTGAEARNSATIASQKIRCGGKSISSASGTINKVESDSFKFSATDSRGYTTSQTVTKTLINYVKLTCSMDAGAASTSGVAKLKISGNYWDGNFGVTNNTLTVQYRYKEQDGTYINWTNLSASVDNSNNTYSATVTISGLNYLKSYTFQARAIDKLATVENNEQTKTTTPIFDWGQDDFTFNVPVHITQYYSNDNPTTKKYVDDLTDALLMGIQDNTDRITALENGSGSGSGSSVGKSDVVDWIYPVGSIYMSVNSTNPHSLFGGTWTQLKDRFLLGAGSTYTNGSTGGEASHTLTVNEMPSHSHPQYVTVSSGGSLSANCDYDSYSSGNARKSSQNVSTDTTGGGNSHNNMPPYLVVYMWKRTA